MNAETKIYQGSELFFLLCIHFGYFTLHSLSAVFFFLFPVFPLAHLIPAGEKVLEGEPGVPCARRLEPAPTGSRASPVAAAGTLQSLRHPCMMPFSMPLPVRWCTQRQAPILPLRCLPELEPGGWAVIL